MNIAELFKFKKTVYSMEVFPPKKAGSVETVYNTLYGLRGLPVDYISVTYGAGGSEQQKQKTCEIASLIKKEYGIEPVSHLTCVGSTKEELKEILTELKSAGIQNILALRGDMPAEGPVNMAFPHASDLAEFIKETDSFFNVTGACYPECHVDAANLDEDIENLKKKVDAGVTQLTTQLFFDNEIFYRFRDKV
ncbi:MAG: methylenetetrahydrofolate reductase, partial [Lachnospiraceae bacterium]|nr:methylenetetrahydrofolate reductase [Lachnospiraceae bacterium]